MVWVNLHPDAVSRDRRAGQYARLHRARCRAGCVVEQGPGRLVSLFTQSPAAHLSSGLVRPGVQSAEGHRSIAASEVDPVEQGRQGCTIDRPDAADAGQQAVGLGPFALGLDRGDQLPLKLFGPQVQAGQGLLLMPATSPRALPCDQSAVLAARFLIDAVRRGGMLSLWQSGAYRLMDDDVPYPSALPTAEGAPSPYKDDDGAVRSEGSGPQSLTRAPQATAAPGAS
uniref:LysR_substrate domain-containing protein n=2 Tax=cellular organisms TaxID=131567 RepID=A0A0N4ZEC9_PARTI